MREVDELAYGADCNCIDRSGFCLAEPRQSGSVAQVGVHFRSMRTTVLVLRRMASKTVGNFGADYCLCALVGARIPQQLDSFQ